MASATSYRYDLDNAQAIYLSNQAILTTVTFSTSGTGQQQQSSQSVSTGQWTAPPEIYKLGGGFVAVISAQQPYYLSIQGHQMQMSAGASGAGIAQQISQLEPLPMQPTEPSSVPSMQPMTPMQPMTMSMGNMSMSMGEMNMGEMNMGEMSLSSQASSSVAQSSAESQPTEARSGAGKKKFCSQCGNSVGAGDRFCAQCGHQLS